MYVMDEVWFDVARECRVGVWVTSSVVLCIVGWWLGGRRVGGPYLWGRKWRGYEITPIPRTGMMWLTMGGEWALYFH